MDASSGQPQEMATHSLESMLVCSKAQQDQRKPRPQPEQALKCPRCDSTNTKFCYYNNYSLTQPRYFCKSCRRYWTKGGTLRNVPVGGGCRKNKRSSSSSSSSSKRSQDQPLISSNTNPLTNFPPLNYDTNDLSLAFARLQKQNGGQLGFDDQHDFSILGNPTSTHFDMLGNPSISSSNNATTPAFLDALRSGFLETQNNFQNLYYGFGNGCNMGDVDHHDHHHHNHDHHGVSAEMLMPYGDHHHHHHHHQMSTTTNATTTAVTVTTTKQELSNNRESESNKVLWGFPWQLNNSDASINNELNSTWHGLLNSPLM